MLKALYETLVGGDDGDQEGVDVDVESSDRDDGDDGDNDENDVLHMLADGDIDGDCERQKDYVKAVEVKTEEEYMGAQFTDEFRIVSAVRDNIVRYDLCFFTLL